ncbi:ATP-binding sensor histidine kinase [Paraburkholderia sp.]|uniref:ATP-binding sensor histidine kinase n=1 Tax=Paraburkholderia sp. TaxID=1926495 RepID=UPI0023A1474C|nr:ATP-binding sensor histidine kinase [Paraburkholderia sp.]MDE1182143.1 AAA family ATPase [Paraburkholderia sp.]
MTAPPQFDFTASPPPADTRANPHFDQSWFDTLVLEALLVDGNIVRYRASTPDGAHAWLIVTATDHPSDTVVRRLQQELALAPKLEPAWAVRPVALVRLSRGPVLVCEDPGGALLHHAADGNLPVARFLRIAVGAARALRLAHMRGILHRDIKPTHLLESDDGTIRLLGVRAQAALPADAHVETPDTLYGTLAYMSPEQARRAERHADERSDLYSLGVTLFELLTGQLPFDAADPVEWVYNHVARQPADPRSMRATVPPVLASILLKLLEKNPAARYQSASSLEADLRRCLADWNETQHIAPFEPAAEDDVRNLALTHRLFGRSREYNALLDAFRRNAQQSVSELILVSGYSGVGKSELVRSVHRATAQTPTLFASGKLEQYGRNAPYAPLMQAVRSLFQRILGERERELAHWRDVLRDALASQGKLLVSFIPELELVVGAQPDVPEIPALDAQLRFQALLTRLISAFATAQHPLILFFDDVHWFDDATLNFIAGFVASVDIRHVLLICAYRDNEARRSPRFTAFLDSLPDGATRITHLNVAPLDPAHVALLLADALHCDSARAFELAEIVHDKTGGNPFFVKQLLLALADTQLIRYDSGAGGWTWDLAGIGDYHYSDNVVDLMVARVSRLPGDAQAVLRHLAFMGRRVDRTTLARVDRSNESDLDRRLQPAVDAGLIVTDRTGFAFTHNRVQEAAYALTDAQTRGIEHARIARILLADLQTSAQKSAFEIAYHIDRAMTAGALGRLDADETQRFANLCLDAARLAKEAVAIQSALNYLVVAQDLLDASGDDYTTTLGYETGLLQVQCHILHANFRAAGMHIEKLLRQPLPVLARAPVFKLKVDMLQHLSSYEAAVDTALDGIELFDTDLPRYPDATDVDRAYGRLRASLGDRSIASLAALPPMRDAVIESEMNLLASLFAPASFVNERLAFIDLCRMVQLTVDHGVTAASAHCLAWFGVYIAEFFDGYADGFEYSRVAQTLVAQRGYRAVATSTLVALDQVSVWTQPLSYALKAARDAFDSARPGADPTMSCYACNHIVSDLLIQGTHLDEVDREIDVGLAFARRIRFEDAENVLALQKRFVQSLTGVSTIPGTFGHLVNGRITFESRLLDTQRTSLRFWLWLLKGVSCYFQGEYAHAAYCLDEAGESRWATPAHIHLLDYHFYSALTHAKRCTGNDNVATTLARIEPHLARLRGWAAINPDTFRDKFLLVEGELARLNGAPLAALSLYEQAAAAAAEHGFNHCNALAHELAARCCEANGLPSAARHHSRSAVAAYTRWGALAKVEQLERIERAESAAWPTRPAMTWPARARPSVEIPAAQEQFDMLSALKSSQALSEEMVPDRLIRTLVTLAIVHAGAQRGMLILFDDDVPVLEAHGQEEATGVHVTLAGERVAADSVPLSIVYTAMRMRKPVVVEDAQSDGRFSFDIAFASRPARSVLCLPLVKQGNATGVLYLENNLTAGVFTSSRTSVLELLASQAAISLETARLYEALVDENTRRKQTEQALRMSEEALALGQKISRSGSYIWNSTTGERYWSDELYNVFCVQRDAGCPNTSAVLERIHPEDVAAYRDAIEHAAQQRIAFQHAFRVVTPDGMIKHLEVLGEPSGVSSFVGVVTDFSERHTTELALQNAKIELARASRATTMGELAASIAHEINQPLASIVSNASAGVRWLNRPVPDIPEALAGLRDIVKDGKRAGNIIRALQSLAKESRPSFVPTFVDRVVRETFVLAAAEIEQKSLAVRLDLRSERPVLADRVQLQQVLFNLIMNAADAMSHLDPRQRVLSVKSRLDGRGSVVVSVQDNGSGISAEIASRIFDAFFTTKDSGMGMGLAICRSIIEAHGGTLTAASVQPAGTVFEFTLPAADHAPFSPG